MAKTTKKNLGKKDMRKVKGGLSVGSSAAIKFLKYETLHQCSLSPTAFPK